MRCTRIAVALTIALAAPAATAATTASAADYPPPSEPGSIRPRPGGTKVFAVCTKAQARRPARRRTCAPTIQAAVDRTRPGDTVKAPPGTYRESVEIAGHAHDGIKLIGSPANPRRTVLDLTRLRAADAQNGVMVNGADGVTVKGFYAHHYLGNGFFAIRVDGYTFSDLVAGWGGAYGIYAFHSKGGTIRDSAAFYNDDSGVYIGETPPQSKPIRSLVTRVRAWGNQLGFSGTNMRYTTITKSQWFDNGLGIVPNALDSEKFPPPEDNVIADNDVFWNNFNYFAGAPFRVRAGAKGLNYPIGTGILLYGSRGSTIERNRVFGHFLVGVGLVDAIELRDPQRAAVRDNTVRDNAFGREGTDLNNVDLFYAGQVAGPNSGNCFAANTGVTTTVPADGSTLAPCPHPGPNASSQAAFQTALGWITDPSHTAGWRQHDHPPFEGITPLVTYRAPSKPAKAKAGAAKATRAPTKTVGVVDTAFTPQRLVVRPGTKVVWRWSATNSEPHDVKLTRGPRGVRKFTSPSGTTGLRYARTLDAKGTYRLLCTFHAGIMTQTIVVR
jgi:plastocyanin